MAVNDDRNEHRIQTLDALRDPLRGKFFSFSVDNGDGEPFFAHEGGDKPRPYRWLDSSQCLSKGLINPAAAIRVDENQVGMA